MVEKTLDKRLQRFRPMYVVLGRAPEDNAWRGRVENSFSMDWSEDRVRLWWSGVAYSFLGEHQISGLEDAKANCPGIGSGVIKQHGWDYLVVDLEDPDCPVEVDFEEWLLDMKQGVRRKYENRNPRFKIKE